MSVKEKRICGIIRITTTSLKGASYALQPGTKRFNTQISDLTSKLKETESSLEKYSFLQVFPERLKSRREKEQ